MVKLLSAHGVRDTIVVVGNGISMDFAQHHQNLPRTQFPFSVNVHTPGRETENLIDNFWELKIVFNFFNVGGASISDFEIMRSILLLPVTHHLFSLIAEKTLNTKNYNKPPHNKMLREILASNESARQPSHINLEFT